MEVGQQIGELVLTRLRPDGRWDALCSCGAAVSRGAHALTTAIRDGLRSRCGACNSRATKDARVARMARREARALLSLEPDVRARVLALVRGRFDAQVIHEAVEIVRLNLDAEDSCPPADPFKCDYRHVYSG